MRKLWLIFAQAVTVALAAVWAVRAVSPRLLPLHGAPPAVTLETAVPGGPPPGSFAAAVRRAMPSVVSIYTTSRHGVGHDPLADDPLLRRFFGVPDDDEGQPTAGLGSGVIVSDSGYILTNNHVVAGADTIQVALADGRQTGARLVGTDPDTDIAVLKIALPHLRAIAFGQSDRVQVGDQALAIGNPFGVGLTVTSGIVSALERSRLGLNTFEHFIQTDAAINPGNSGGALVDANGALIGINSAIYSRSGGSMGIGFAIPVNLARQVMDQLIKDGQVTRGWIGVEVQDLTPELAESFHIKARRGALVAAVLRGAPADQAGIRPGDVLVAIDGRPVNNATDMLNITSALRPGRAATFRLLRRQSERDAAVVVGRRPPPRG